MTTEAPLPGHKDRERLMVAFREDASSAVVGFAGRNGLHPKECVALLMDVADPAGRAWADVATQHGGMPVEQLKVTPDWDRVSVLVLAAASLAEVETFAQALPFLQPNPPDNGFHIVVVSAGGLHVFPVVLKPRADAVGSA